jgi:hypothetical protein
VTAHGHEECTCGMCSITIRSEPNMHARTQAHVGCGSNLQHISSTSALGYAGHAVILRVQPSEGGADKPFTSYVTLIDRVGTKARSAIQGRCLAEFPVFPASGCGSGNLHGGQGA